MKNVEMTIIGYINRLDGTQLNPVQFNLLTEKQKENYYSVERMQKFSKTIDGIRFKSKSETDSYLKNKKYSKTF